MKSGYDDRINAPIDTVPEAGARTGAANGDEYIASSLAIPDLEDGLVSPNSYNTSFASSSSGLIPHLHV